MSKLKKVGLVIIMATICFFSSQSPVYARVVSGQNEQVQSTESKKAETSEILSKEEILKIKPAQQDVGNDVPLKMAVMKVSAHVCSEPEGNHVFATVLEGQPVEVMSIEKEMVGIRVGPYLGYVPEQDLTSLEPEEEEQGGNIGGENEMAPAEDTGSTSDDEKEKNESEDTDIRAKQTDTVTNTETYLGGDEGTSEFYVAGSSGDIETYISPGIRLK